MTEPFAAQSLMFGKGFSVAKCFGLSFLKLTLHLFIFKVCFEVRLIFKQVGSYYYYPLQKKVLQGFLDITNWHKEWFCAKGDWEMIRPSKEIEPSIPCQFGDHNHAPSSSIPTLDSLTSFRMSRVLNLVLVEKDVNLLLSKERLAAGID